MSEFEIVERPVSRSGNQSAEVVALIETATSGQALRMPLNGLTHAQLSARLYARLSRHGYCLRTFKDGNTLVMWAVKKS